MDNKQLINRLKQLQSATPICEKAFYGHCVAEKGIVCMFEKDCINEQIRKLIKELDT